MQLPPPTPALASRPAPEIAGTEIAHALQARRGDGPAYRQIYERLRGGILAGELASGARLPSARSLASQLAVARGTVEAAYQLLAGEGYIVGRGAAGTFVESALAGTPARPGPAPLPARRSRHAPRSSLAFRMGVPALDAFPRKLWSRLTARAGRSLAESDLDYQDDAGLETLRRTIAAYLRVARGIACTAEQIIVTSGYQGSLALIGQALIQPGDQVWVEDPGYHFARLALALSGAALVPVPADGNGLDVAAGRRAAPRARFAMVTPCHHFPLGGTLPIARRLALLDWADAAGAFIIEDDYDSEFRYRGRPLPALKSSDARQRVLYAGTFSKVLFPALRLGYLVVPESLAERFRDACIALHAAPPALTQQVVAAFIEEGHFARHIRRMRRLYAERRRALAAAIRDTCGALLTLETPPGGMHLIARLPDGADDVAIAAKAATRDLHPVPLSATAMRGGGTPGLLIGFTNVAAEAAPDAARRLREILAG